MHIVLEAFIAIVVMGVLFAIPWMYFRIWQEAKDKAKIHKFLRISTLEFRTTAEIAARTNLPEARVVAICEKHPKIRRHAREESWTASD